VEFQYRPYKKIVINEVLICSIDDLIHMALLSTPPYASSPPLRWCKGWVFNLVFQGMSERGWKEQTEKGTVYWNSVTLAPFPVYHSHIDVNQGQVKIPLLDLSYSETMVAFIDWFKRAFKGKIAILPEETIKPPGIV